MERRKAPRIRCSLACEVRLRGRAAEGRLRNVSEGGLALEVAVAPGEGEALTIRFAPPGRPPIEIVALVWHVRAARREGAPRVLGLVLSRAGDDYFQWLASLARPARPAAPKPPPPAVRQRFAVRVAQVGSPRSRRILVVADSADTASARALAEVGQGWIVAGVETLRAPR